MNREILFRGKDKATNQWVYGDYTHNEGLNTHYISRNVNNTSRKVWEVDPDTVGQYTGLTDKERNKIFEGDILRLTGSTSNLTVEVVYNEEDTSFILKLTSIDEVSARTLGSWLSLGYECAIIGSVCDNPELMKGDRQR